MIIAYFDPKTAISAHESLVSRPTDRQPVSGVVAID